MNRNEESIFRKAREMSGETREAYLQGACGGDIALRTRVNALLDADPDTDVDVVSSLASIAPESSCDASDRERAREVPAERAGQMIGRYKLLQPIGEGGFGTVWMAEQRKPMKRRVALKIIKLGMDTKQVITRFEAERQALAMMDHPNIATVLDAGSTEAGSTEAGRPYFVMEYVKGIDIQTYCDKETLDTEARLGLFINVCRAIQHAHQKGVIHRDIKPSNVMVTLQDGAPIVKVIDFGLAKATNVELTQKTLFTEHRQLMGTPVYMSPEQAEMSGLDIDTRSDIYSLGILLYELLTSTTPFDTQLLMQVGIVEMLRIICEEEPQKPSTRFATLGETATTTARQRGVDVRKLGLILKGDLDWIVVKCLEKNRTRRYETVSGLAMDIERYLSDEEVLASPPNVSYRLGKLVRRNRVAFAAAAVVFLALSFGAVGTTVGMLRAMAAEDRAEVEAANAQFRLRFTRDEAARTVGELNRVLWTARRAEELAHFVPERVLSQYPDSVIIGFDSWLGELLPELGPTTVDAIDRGVRLPDRVAELLKSYVEAPDAVRSELLYDWVRDNRDRLRTLMERIGEGGPVATLGWRAGRPLWEGHMPSLTARKQAVALLGAYAVTQHLDGNHEIAVGALRAARGLARATGSSGYVITVLAAVAMHTDIYHLVRWMIVRALRGGVCPDAYIEFVVEDAPIQPMDAGIRFESMAARQAAGELFQVREVGGRPRPDPKAWREMEKGYENPPAEVEFARIELDATLEAIETALDVYLRLADERGIEIGTEEPPAIEALVRPEVASFLVPRLTSALRRWAGAQRQRDATIITASIAVYRNRRGAWPPDLDTALSGFPVQPLRRDHFGHDFVYRVEGDQPVLHAVGPNLSDDGGDGAGKSPLDEVFLGPLSPAESNLTERDD